MSKISTLLSRPLVKWNRERQSSGVSVDWTIDNPKNNMPGSLISGRMILSISEDSTQINSFDAALRLHTTQKQPFRKSCSDCKTQDMKIKEWNFMSKSTVLPRGKHEFPFSVVIPDELPASIDSSIVSISYKVEAKACLESRPRKSGDGACVSFKQDILVQPPPPILRLPHSSSHMFQSTGIEVTARFNRMIDTQGTNQARFKIYGLLKDAENGEYSEIWHLSKGSWKLEECIKSVAPACKRHLPGGSDDQCKGATRTKLRTLASKDFYEGWKAYDRNGVADLDFNFGLRQSAAVDSRAQHHFNAPTLEGTDVFHSLLVKLVFIKELVLRDKPKSAIRTGEARILHLPYRVLFSSQPEEEVESDDDALDFHKEVFLYSPTEEEDIQSTVLDY